MQLLQALSVGFTFCLLSGSALSQDYVESFDGSVNAGGWTFGSTIEGIDAGGGNPGAHLHNSNIDTFAPQCRTTVATNPFHGDWRAMGVNSFGLDLKTYSTNFGFAREASLILSNGTCSVSWLGTELVPQVAEGWKSFDFNIDSASTTMPSGWKINGDCTGDDATWNAVITNVTEVRLFYGNPEFFFIFDTWNVGMDNARIGTAVDVGAAVCSGDGSGTNCPCSNNSVAGEGCKNSTGQGAILAGSGSSSAGSDNLILNASQLPPGKPCLLFLGDILAGGGAGLPFGDGLRCAGGNVQRMGTLTASQQGTGSWGPGLAAQAGLGSGDTRYFQVWYRDNSIAPCNLNFNLSSALEVQFTN
ncbi:MAG: hypothetical protein ACI8X5_003697 [Planctomycetota bacterium]|jgi:hypothetical protein